MLIQSEKENKRTDNVIEQQSEQKIPHFNTRFEFFNGDLQPIGKQQSVDQKHIK